MAKRYVFLVAALALALVVGGTAAGAPPDQQKSVQRADVPGVVDNAGDTNGAIPRPTDGGPPAQHGPTSGHLPPSQANVDLVGKLKVSNVGPGFVADLAVLRNSAFLAKWSPGDVCPGGFWSVDFSKPSAPQELSFVSSPPGTYLTEGMHALRLTTPTFAGDILVASQEVCGRGGLGGIAIYDVTNPASPVLLGNGADRDERALGHSSHSAYAWDAGDRAFAIAVDNFEFEDVDIFDITDPRNPVLIKETGILDWPNAGIDGFGEVVFLHDIVVRKVAGDWIALLSYWDVGFVVLNVNDPANPVFVKDSEYPATDPFTGVSPPEGNAHEAEYSGCPEEGVPNLKVTCERNPQFILGADEDFSPTRTEFRITTGTNAGTVGGGQFGWTVPIEQNFGDGVMNGPTIFGGSGCVNDVNENGVSDRAEVPPASSMPDPGPGEEKIVVFVRGECFFSEKVRSGEEAGYKAVVIANHHIGALGGRTPNAFICGGQGSPTLDIASATCTGHRALHLIFNDPPQYEPTSGGGAAVFYGDLPPIGTRGEKVSADPGVFDGWGFLNLIDADTMKHVDQYSVPEAQDPRFASGFGDLTIHEITTDAEFPVGYTAWYSAGARVVQWNGGNLREVGHFIDEGGNDFWGVEFHMRKSGKGFKRFFLNSDRDFGLYVFRFGTDLRVTKRAPRQVRVGQTFAYRFTVRNPGTINARKVVTRDRLPRGVRFVSASASQGRCGFRRATRTVVCRLGRLPEGARARITIRVQATRAGVVRNTASVRSPQVDYDTGNNSTRAVTRVLRAKVGARLTGSR